MALRAAIADQQKTPGSFPPGAVVQANFTVINRSGIEVPVHAEARRPHALVGDGTSSVARNSTAVGSGRSRKLPRYRRDKATRRRRRLDLGVRNVETQIGAGINVPLRPRTDGPRLPVVVAANVRNR